MRKFNIIMILRLRFATKDLFVLLSALASQEAHFPVLVSEGLAWFVCLVIGELLAQLATGILPSSLSLSKLSLACAQLKRVLSPDGSQGKSYLASRLAPWPA